MESDEEADTLLPPMERTVHIFRMTASGTMAIIGSGSSPSTSEEVP